MKPFVKFLVLVKNVYVLKIKKVWHYQSNLEENALSKTILYPMNQVLQIQQIQVALLLYFECLKKSLRKHSFNTNLFKISNLLEKFRGYEYFLPWWYHSWQKFYFHVCVEPFQTIMYCNDVTPCINDHFELYVTKKLISYTLWSCYKLWWPF